ncbi:sulfatase-like hydrolase/transferase [Natrialbaceae archaeon A-chndr2]
MRNVVLLCLDTVRKDYFDEFAPRLTERAEAVYHQCRAASGWSVPSHASMFTGELPHVHGVHTHARDFTRIDLTETFLEGLPDHARIGVSTNAYASRYYGFDSFFEEFSQVPHAGALQFDHALSPRDPDLWDVGHLEYVRRALQDAQPIRSLTNGVLAKVNPYDLLFSGWPWPEIQDKGTKKALSEATSRILTTECIDRPVFAFLNLMDAHVPMYHHRGLNRELHSVPNSWTSKGGPSAKEVNRHPGQHHEFVRNYEQLYSASIEYLDRQVDAWIDEIQRRTEHPTTIVITADHGENLGSAADEERFEHHSSLSEAILHVPLVLINPPDGYPYTESKLVSHLELGELLVRLAHGERYSFGDEPITGEVIGHTGEDAGGAYWDRLIRCAYTDQRKIRWDSLGRTAVFDLDLDTETRVKRTTADELDGFPIEDTTLFESDILASKRMALECEPQVEQVVNGERKRQLAQMGYL